jgi:two-component system chemotaxis sensor kinase CheA
MDVVKTNIEKIGGVVDIASEVGRGTTLHIKIPLTLAIIPGLVVMAGNERFVIPQSSLLELIALGQENGSTRIEHIHGVPVYRRRGKLLPLVYLHRILGLPKETERSDAQKIVVLQADERQFGLVVDRVCDSQETVVKALGKQLRGLDFYAGACIMGDGKVALILDVMGVGKRARLLAETHGAAEKSDTSEATAKETHTFLVFAGQNESRMAVPIELVDRLEKIKAGKLERAGVQWVTQYRGQILPLIDLRSTVGDDRRSATRGDSPIPPADEVLQLFVCHHAGMQVGFIVHRIIDTIKDTIQLTYPATRPGVLYSAVIKEKVTEVVDVAQIVTAAGVQIESPATMAVAAGETR